MCNFKLAKWRKVAIMTSFFLAKKMTLLLTKRLTGATSAVLSERFGRTLGAILTARGVVLADELDLKLSHLVKAETLLDIDKAVTRIDRAIDSKQKILVVGDFDCDGATSTALMVRALTKMGALVNFLVPDRFVFGYGLTAPLVQHAYDAFSPHLIITVDNGISSFDGVDLAHKMGIDVVITDHHLTTVPAPKACAVVNPNQLTCGFASKALVGVGVAFYVMGRLAKMRKQAGKPSDDISRYLDLVALGTVADIGVLDHNNRILVAYGLAKIQQGDCCQGILALLAQAGKSPQKTSVRDLGFLLAPRINAAGRMDTMDVGIQCLLSDTSHKAQTLAFELEQLNHQRRKTQAVMKQEAEQMLQGVDDSIDTSKRAVILYDDDWHQGVIGIVAGRIKDSTYRPTLIFAPADKNKTGDDDLIKASARSIKGIHIRDVLVQVDNAYPNLIVHFGGHAMAAGLTLYKKDFERFCAAFYEVMASFDEAVFIAERFTDGVLAPEEISLDFAERLENISVWGHGFEFPSFDGVFDIAYANILKDKHLKLGLTLTGVQYPIDAIWFNFDPARWDYRAKRVHILYEMAINEWQGRRRVQFMVQELAVVG